MRVGGFARAKPIFPLRKTRKEKSGRSILGYRKPSRSGRGGSLEAGAITGREKTLKRRKAQESTGPYLEGSSRHTGDALRKGIKALKSSRVPY
jgi:hypothetical protein